MSAAPRRPRRRRTWTPPPIDRPVRPPRCQGCRRAMPVAAQPRWRVAVLGLRGCLAGRSGTQRLALIGENARMYAKGATSQEHGQMNANVVDVRNTFSDYLNRAQYQGERIIIERRGKPVAAIVPLADVELLEQLETQADIKAARKARKEKGRPVALSEVKARLGMK